MRVSLIADVVLVSSSDIRGDIDALERTVFDWNRLHGRNANIQFVPTRWENDVVPALSGPPQAVINGEIVDTADAMIALFWTRLGSPTEAAESGTAEEIDRFVARQKRPAVYRCKRALPPETCTEQLRALNEYELRMRPRGLIFSYETEPQLARLVHKYLQNIAVELRGAAESQNQSRSAQDANRLAHINQIQHSWEDIVYVRRQFELSDFRRSLTGSIEGDALTPFVGSGFDRMLQGLEETILRLPEDVYRLCEGDLAALRDLRAGMSQQGGASMSLNEAVLYMFGPVIDGLLALEQKVLTELRTASAA